MNIQEWIYRLEEGRWARTIKIFAFILGFIALATYYDFHCYRGFGTQEAMESAQMARNIAGGKGFTTDSMSPAALGLLSHQLKQHSLKIKEPLPDLQTPPAWPVLLAGWMKTLPFRFQAADNAIYQPELLIGILNQILFLVAGFLTFTLARKLFDPGVAIFAAAVFLGTELFWRFSLSGLSTLLLMVLFLVAAHGLVAIEAQSRDTAAPQGRSLAWSIVIGLVLALGMLSRYSFGWLMVPVVIFVWQVGAARRIKLTAMVIVSFLVLLTPWLIRNYSLSGNCFGTAGYAAAQNTWAFPDDTFERAVDLQPGLRRMQPEFLIDKIAENTRALVQNELPKAAGSWIGAFFLVGLFLPFRNPGLSRLRYFLLRSLGILVLAQALGQTHLTLDSPSINSENLLVIAAPLIIIFGAGMLFTLFAQWNVENPLVRNFLLTILGGAFCAPLFFTFIDSPPYPLTVPYFPAHIQRTAGWMEEREVIMSDIPWAVAWYGQRPSLLLSLDTDAEFVTLGKLVPIKAVYLTQKTGDKHFQSGAISSTKSWERFLVGVWAHDEVPDGFPLVKAPTGYWPDQTFLSDRARWLKRPPENGTEQGKKQ